jgi:hypothetical protein
MIKKIYATSVLIAICLTVSCLLTTVGCSTKAGMDPDQARLMKMAQRANDVIDVQNLMARLCRDAESYEYYGNDLANLMALKTPGTSYLVPMGPVGGEEITKNMNERTKTATPLGQIHEFKLSSPIIEIAGDGKTAQGLWDLFGADVENNKDTGGWLSVSIGGDFVKEDGQWKIWHVLVYPKYLLPTNKTWVDNAAKTMKAPGIPPGLCGPKDQKTQWIWDGKSNRPRGVPWVPVPYEHFDLAHAYN